MHISLSLLTWYVSIHRVPVCLRGIFRPSRKCAYTVYAQHRLQRWTLTHAHCLHLIILKQLLNKRSLTGSSIEIVSDRMQPSAETFLLGKDEISKLAHHRTHAAVTLSTCFE